MTGPLDTHTLLWELRLPQKLGRNARHFLESEDNNIVVSAASA